MSETKCCCNCLHCARWKKSSGIECHCDIDDRYLGYLDVMNEDNDCCRWEKETKWDEAKKHDTEVRAEAIEEYRKEMHVIIEGNEEFTDWQKLEILECNELVAEQLKEKE